MKTKLIILITTQLLVLNCIALSQIQIKNNPKRHVININNDWLYLEDNTKNISALEKSKWEKINLPHTWNNWDVLDSIPGYRCDASWYKKELYIPKLKNNLRFVLYFEGVNISSEIFVNNNFAGTHVGGYVGFEIDITDFIITDKINTLLVRVTNENNPYVIPSKKSDFAICGGITRDVWLKILPMVSISKIKISTPYVTKTNANTNIETIISNTSEKNERCKIVACLINKTGKIISEAKIDTVLSRGNSRIIVNLPVVKNPELWSPINPTLYSIQVKIVKNKIIIDELKDKFGFRWFEFKEHGPFYLNGERLLIRGTHIHEDHAGFASALPNNMHRKHIKMIKEIGANLVRLAHYPQDPEVYRACDELGLMVIDELPWCRGGVGPQEWKDNTKRLLEEQIEQNYNHPSIILHSLGNEMTLLAPDFKNGHNKSAVRAMVKELNDISHAIDPYRLTCARQIDECNDLVDVACPSIWPGWYGGSYEAYEDMLKSAQENFPRFLHVEYGAESHAGRHVENPKMTDWRRSDWSETYAVSLFDWYLHVAEQSESLTGNVQWTFKDFPSPQLPTSSIPYMNQKGIVNRDGTPKDGYYVFKSYWIEYPKFCYIESHSWDERSGPLNVKRTIRVYSNCKEVELILNGKTLGKQNRDIKKYPACGLSWNILFNEGKNIIQAIGYDKNKKVAKDSISVTYFYTKNLKPEKINLTKNLSANGNILITAIVVDANGRRCIDYNKKISFYCDGNGKLLSGYGTPTRSSSIEMSNGKAQIEFKPEINKPATIQAISKELRGFIQLGK